MFVKKGITLPNGIGKGRPEVGSPLHESPSWSSGVPCGMQRHTAQGKMRTADDAQNNNTVDRGDPTAGRVGIAGQHNSQPQAAA